MRILILANYDLGLYKFRKELIEELLNLGHEVYISLPDGDLVRPFEKMGCTFIDTPVDRRGINPKTDFGLFQHYRKMMKEVNPDLVITYTIKPNIYGGIAARLAKKQYAVNITGLGTAFENAGLIRTVVVNLYKFALKKARSSFLRTVATEMNLFLLVAAIKRRLLFLMALVSTQKLTAISRYPHNEVVKFLFVGRVMKRKVLMSCSTAMQRLVAEGQKVLLGCCRAV